LADGPAPRPHPFPRLLILPFLLPRLFSFLSSERTSVRLPGQLNRSYGVSKAATSTYNVAYVPAGSEHAEGGSVGVTCRQCGAVAEDGDRFCGDCGAPVGGCPSCGAPLTPGKRFCRACGAALVQGTPGLRIHDAGAAAAAVDEAREIAARLRCQPLLDRAGALTPQDSPTLTPQDSPRVAS
jgi:Double zinc ribbon